MENKTKLALFVGGSVDGQVIELKEIEPRLNWYGSDYISRGIFQTKQYGAVQLYILEEMKVEEERQRLELIKKVL